MKPSVLHVYRTYFPDPPGGLQEAIRQIALSTTDLGLTNTVFTLSPRPVPQLMSLPEARVIRLRSWAAPSSCDLGGIESFITFAGLAKEADILQYHFPWPFADMLHAISGSDRPAIMTYHSDIVRQRWLGKVYAPLMWRTLRQMRVVVATSPAYQATSPVLSHPQVRDKVRVIPLGIVEDSYPKHGDSSILERLGISFEEPFFLFIGVLRYYKGVHFLIRAALGLGAKVVIAGSGPERETLEALSKEIGAQNIIFAGQVTDAEKVALLKSCRALVLPSHLRSEAFGMVLVEAAMFGRPLISCEIGTGTSYVNAHEVTGLVVAPEAPDRLAWAMNCLLSDSGLASTMGLDARARYDQLFSGPALGRAYADAFKEAMR
jgi:glycosyltransferase involved in cell wall biosynthesis